MMTLLAMIPVGIVGGIFAGFFGIGGGIVLIPILVLLFKYPQHTANGITLMTFLLPAGILGVIQYFKAGNISSQHIKISLMIALGIFLGSYIGSKIAIQVSDQIMRKSFSILLVIVALRLWITK